MTAEVLDVEGEEVEPDHTTEIVLADARSSALMRPVASEHDVVEAFKAYQQLREALLEPSDFQEAERGKHFVKKSGWRKLSTAMGCSTKITDEHYDHDDKGRVIRARVTVRAIAPNGRFEEGIGICDYRERCCPRAYAEPCTKSHKHCDETCTGLSHFSKSQHDIPSTAHTRAKNRALSDLFGFGEVSAEEITGGVGETRVPDEPADGDQVAEIVAALNGIADKAQRTGVKMAFVTRFGQPHELMKSQIDAARRMVSAAGGKFTGTAAAEGSGPTDAPARAAGSSVSGEAVGHVGAPQAESREDSTPPPESPDSDDSPATHQGPGAVEESGPAAGPVPVADPAAPPVKPSTKQQRSRIAMRVKELTDKDLLRDGDKPELVAILTGERTNTTTEMSYDEANHMVSLLAFIESDDLRVEDDENGGRQVACATERGKDFLAPIVAAFA